MHMQLYEVDRIEAYMTAEWEDPNGFKGNCPMARILATLRQVVCLLSNILTVLFLPFNLENL